MPRVSDERIHNGLDKYDSGEFVNWNGYFVVDVLRDLQDARAALKAIMDWKDRTTDEPPLTYIERVAREVVG